MKKRKAPILAALWTTLACAAAPATAEVLVSNINQSGSGGSSIGAVQQAQGFTTGSNSGGYTIESVEAKFGTQPSGVTVRLATGLPSSTTEVATLTSPASLSVGNNTFTAPDNTTLSAGTTYFVVVSGNGGTISTTTSDNEDAGAAAGWSIGNDGHFRSGNSGSWNVAGTSRMIRVNGSAVDSSTPTITIAAGTSPVNEGTGATFTVTADTAPSANLTVMLSVAEATGSDFVAAGDEGDQTVTITSGTTSATYTVTTQDDSTDEPNGDVTVTVAAGTGYTVGSTSSASVTVNDNDDPADTAAPTFSSASVNGDELTITFDEALAAAGNLANTAFTVKKTPSGGSEAEVSLSNSTAPSISGSTVVLTLATAVVSTDGSVKVSYDKPTTGMGNTIKDAAGNETASFSDQSVTNDTVLTISFPRPSAGSTIEGMKASFRLVASEAPSENLTVNLHLSESQYSDYVATGDEGPNTVSFAANTTTAHFEVGTVDDNTDEPNGVIGLRIDAGTGYTVGTLDYTRKWVNDNDARNLSTLVSTMRQTRGHPINDPILDVHDVAVGFTTGPNSSGYTLDAIQVAFIDNPENVSVKLATGVSSSSAGSVVATLTSPTSVSNGHLYFDASADTILSASTTYYVVIEGSKGQPVPTLDGDEDGAATGWSVDDNFFLRNRDSPGSWRSQDATLRLAVNGTTNVGPTITIAAGTSPVTEGTTAEFTVTANPAPSANLTVNLSVADASDSDFLATSDEGSKTVTITSGATTATYSVTTQSDSTDEPDGDVTVTVASGTGYMVGSTSSASVTVNDDDEPARAVITDVAITSTPVGDPDDDGVPDTYLRGDDIEVTVTWDRDVTWDVSADNADLRVRLTIGTTNRSASLVTGGATSGTSRSAKFRYTVVDGDTDSDGLTVTPNNSGDLVLRVNGGTVRAGGRAAQRDHAGLTTAQANHLVDGSMQPTAPDAPGTPTVTSLSSTSVSVSWSAPFLTGSAASVSDYDLRYYAGTTPPVNADDWIEEGEANGPPNPGTNTSATITGLTSGTNYWVQVRAEGHGLESAWSGEGALNPAITILPSSSTVTEGRFAQFTLYPFPTWSTDLTVNLTVADAGGTSDFVASGDEGAKTFTIHAGNPFADYQVRTVSDATDEPDGDVTVTVEPGTGYVVGSPSSASVTVNDDDMVVNPAITLVSTIGQPASTGQGNLDSADLAQEFTTGSNSTGYTLESIALDFRDTPRGVSVKLATGLSRTSAGTVVATLTNPALSSGTLTFTAPSNTTLSASTTYYVVVEGTSGVWLRTDSNAEDAGAAAGWSVADGFLWRQRTSSAGWSTGSSTYRIRVDGTANAAASPTITIAAGTSPVTEGTAAEFTVTASEAPSENLTVNLSVADAGGTSDFV
ncbi:MAG: hypothetical protein F4X98_17780, partial [Gammaproteobacteria bacterium]|nr:hypothetical protein [Gammaproteobacteria bacterium]